MTRHRADLRLPPEVVGASLLASAVLFVAALCLAALAAATPAPQPGTVTRTVPGPTTTVSYLIEVTVTPGVNGY